MFRFFSRCLFMAMLVAMVVHGASRAQSVTARFSGEVTDPDGGAIPGASVQVINQETLARRETKTDASAYILASLPPGRYQIVVQAEGFDRKSSDIITVVAGQNFVFNVRMSLGSVQTDVQVSAGAGVSAVETDTASISTTLGQEEVTGYALNGRNFSQLITMAPASAIRPARTRPRSVSPAAPSSASTAGVWSTTPFRWTAAMC